MRLHSYRSLMTCSDADDRIVGSAVHPVNATETMKRPANNTTIDFLTAFLLLFMFNPPIIFGQFIIMVQVNL